MSKARKRRPSALTLIILLIVVVVSGVLFVGATSGWFDNTDTRVVLDEEYHPGKADFLSLGANEYEELLGAQKSFIIFVDQEGCTTADRLNEYITKYIEERGIIVYRMMFSDVKESSLHDQVKYYPSMVIVSKGKPVAWLKADSDDDAEFYNNYEKFEEWLNERLKI